MDGVSRDIAITHVERIVDSVETDRMPVPVREIWVYGDVALGLDPIERLDVYVTKDMLFHDDTDQNVEEQFSDVDGIGQTVRAAWACEYPEYIKTNASGYIAPEQCLGAHLLDGMEAAHMEVCNTGFEDNVTQRLAGALERESYEEVLDPRGVCLWDRGTRSDTALEKLRNGDLVFPPLSEALTMIGAEEQTAERIASVIEERRQSQDGISIRGDVV